jgi:triphosphatase
MLRLFGKIMILCLRWRHNLELSMARETELKLALTSQGARAVQDSCLLPGKPTNIELHSTYFDTPDHLLSKSGLSLRIRHSDGTHIQTLKGDGVASAGLFVRSEWERSVDDDRPMIDDATPIPALLGEKVREIGPIFEVHVHRMIWEIQDNETHIEVALDRGEVIAGNRREPICEIELELKAGVSSALFAWARRIDAIAAAHLGVLSKAERGYRLRGAMARSFKAESISLAKDDTAEVAFQKIVGANLRQFRLNETLIEEQNTEALHQARVSLRRLGSALTIFKPVVVDVDYPKIREEIRWLVGELGKARNIDVVSSMAPANLLHQLENARAIAYCGVSETLGSTRTRTLLINLAEWVVDGAWLSQNETGGKRKQSAEVYAREVLRQLRKKLKKSGNISACDDEQRHEVRKTAKKLRFASEFFASLFDSKNARRRHKRFLGALERLQDKLGTLNDFAMMPLVLKQIGLGDFAQSPALLSTSEKAQLLIVAADAYDELLDAKRFWK